MKGRERERRLFLFFDENGLLDEIDAIECNSRQRVHIPIPKMSRLLFLLLEIV